MVKGISTAILCYLSIGVFTVSAQPLRGNEAKRWQAAWSAAQQGRYQEALEGFKTALENNADQHLFVQAGSLLQRQGAVAQAEELYLWGRARLNQPRVFADRLAGIYQSRQKYDLAAAEWMRLLPSQAELVKARMLEIGQNIGLPKAAALAEANIKNAGDPGWLVVGSLHLAAKNDRQAWGSFRRIKDIGMQRRAVDQMLAAGLPGANLIPVLEEFLARREGRDQDLLAKLGWHYMEALQFQKALEVFSRMLPLDRPLATVLMARASLRQGDHARTIRLLDEKDKGKPWPDSLRWEACFLEAQARLMSGDAMAAAGIYRKTAADSTVGREIRQKAFYLLAELGLMSGEVDSALAGYRRAVQLGLEGELSNDAMLRMILISEHKADRMKALAVFGRGLGERARHDFAGAARSFSQAAEEHPGTTLADQSLLELAQMLQEEGAYRKAAEAWGRLAESASDQQVSCRASYQQGMVLKYHLNRAAEAADVWRKAVVKSPDFSWSDLMRQELAISSE